MILTPEDIGAVVSAVVCIELGAESAEVCGGADALVSWVLALPEDSRDLARFSSALDRLGMATAAHVENLFRRRAA